MASSNRPPLDEDPPTPATRTARKPARTARVLVSLDGPNFFLAERGVPP